MINSITDSVSIFHYIHMKEYNFQTGCVRGKNYYGGKDYYIAVFPLGGKDYYIAIFPGGKATMGEKLLYNTGFVSKGSGIYVWY